MTSVHAFEVTSVLGFVNSMNMLVQVGARDFGLGSKSLVSDIPGGKLLGGIERLSCYGYVEHFDSQRISARRDSLHLLLIC